MKGKYVDDLKDGIFIVRKGGEEKEEKWERGKRRWFIKLFKIISIYLASTFKRSSLTFYKFILSFNLILKLILVQ